MNQNDTPIETSRKSLPWWTWVAPLVIFHAGTLASLHFKQLPGVSSVYFPTSLGIVLIHWWGPRILLPLYLNAVVCVPLWDLPMDYAPLYALPETLVAAGSWLLTRRFKTDCAMPNRYEMLVMLGLGALLPAMICNLYLYRQLVVLENIRPDQFWLAMGHGQLSDLIVFLAVGVPLCVFATEPLRRAGLALSPRAAATDASVPSEIHQPYDRILLASALAALTVVALLFSVQHFWFMYAAPVLATALLSGHRLGVVTMTWTFLLVLIIPAYSKEAFGATWRFDVDHVQVFLNLCTLSIATLLTGRTISDLRIESERRERATRSLRLQEEVLRAFMDNSPAVIHMKDLDGKYTLVNHAFEALAGKSRADVIGKKDEDVFSREAVEGFRKSDKEALELGKSRVYESVVSSASETRKYFSIKFPLFDADAKPYALCGISTDVSDLTRATAALEKSENFLRIALESARMGTWSFDVDTGQLQWSDSMEAMFGLAKGSFTGQLTFFESLIHPSDREPTKRAIRNAIEGSSGSYRAEYRVAWPNGDIHWYDSRGYVSRSTDGKPLRMSGVVFDKTEHKQLEASLQQAQKVESIGRLAGGVAHDFNNLLTSIVGFAELAKMGRSPAVHIDSILESARRGAGLTQQLLAFARKKVVKPEAANLNRVIENMHALLHRLIGDNIILEVRPARDLAAVMIDVGSIEQVIMNLCVNARDAMPDHGHLTIETQNVLLEQQYAATHPEVPPGRYVMLAVSDTGTGMDEKTLASVFEPFFTTRPMGKGTGLGLAMCHGIVKQAGGHIAAYSELGKGSTFKIYLPQADVPVLTPAPTTEPPQRRGSETILLVEDDELIRRSTSELLEDLGYRVLIAANGFEALAIAKQHAGPIHLLITDVVMPRMGGRELAAQLQEARKEIKVLYSSGYTENAIVHHGVLNTGVNFIQKPFGPSELSKTIRGIIDA